MKLTFIIFLFFKRPYALKDLLRLERESAKVVGADVDKIVYIKVVQLFLVFIDLLTAFPIVIPGVVSPGVIQGAGRLVKAVGRGLKAFNRVKINHSLGHFLVVGYLVIP